MNVRRAVALAAILVAPYTRSMPDLSSELSRFPRTGPKTWSSAGWEGLRWGMGPGDVEVHVGPKGMNLGGVYEEAEGPKYGREPRGNSPEPRLRTFILRESARQLGAENTMVRFEFLDDGLWEVSEQPVIPEGDFQRAARWTWNTRVELAKKWGDPKAEKGKEYLQASERDKGGFKAAWDSARGSGAVILSSSTLLTAVAFSVDPKRGPEAARLQREEAASITIGGTVREVKTAPPYAYARLATSKGAVWVAIPAAPLEVGQYLCVAGALPMSGFESPTLGRKFEVLYLGAIGAATQCK